ncbi:unnamed protein product, partial [Cladocopium goreaui]
MQSPASWRGTAQIVEEMAWKRLEVNEVSFGMAMNAYGKKSNWQDACMLLEGLSDSQLETNQVISGTFLAACEKGSLWPCALHIVEAHAAQGLEMSGIARNSLLSSVAQQHWERASSLLFHLPVQANIISFNSVQKKGQWSRALALCITLQCSGLTVSITTCNTLISTCNEGDSWQLALVALEHEIIAGLEVDCITRNSLMSRSPWRLAMSLQDQPDWTAGTDVDAFASSSLISSLRATSGWRWGLVKLARTEAERVQYNAAMAA